MIIERVTKLLLGSVGVTDRSMDRMWVGFVNRAINASIWLAFIRPVKIKYQITDCKDKPHVQFGKKHNIFLIWNVNQHYPIEGIGYGSGELIKIGIHNWNYLWIFPDIKYTKVLVELSSSSKRDRKRVERRPFHSRCQGMISFGPILSVEAPDTW